MTTADKIKREMADVRQTWKRMRIGGLRPTVGGPAPTFSVADMLSWWGVYNFDTLQDVTCVRVFLVNVLEILERKSSFGDVLSRIEAMLLEKNAAYGDSALHPLRVFSDAPPDAALRVRIDDKLSRLLRGSDAGEDTLGDLAGYLVLLLVSMRGDQ